MPGTYRIDLVNRIVWSHAWGVAADSMLEAHARHLGADPRFERDFRQYWDLRDITDMRITRVGLTLAAKLNPFGPSARRAIVVASDTSFGLARMYDLLRGESGDVIQVFRDRAAALEWLGLPASAEPPPGSPTDLVFDFAPDTASSEP
jgi:hypothetical protein